LDSLKLSTGRERAMFLFGRGNLRFPAFLTAGERTGGLDCFINRVQHSARADLPIPVLVRRHLANVGVLAYDQRIIDTLFRG
jgi:hypothetical protein